MKTATCKNENCCQKDIDEYFMGEPDAVMCGVCWESCELSEPYDDPELPEMGQP